MNWYKCYDEKAGKWVEPYYVVRDGIGFWTFVDNNLVGYRQEKAYRETGISVNCRELIEGDRLRCTYPHKEIEGIIAFLNGSWVIQCTDGNYPLDNTIKYGKVRTGHISGEGR